MKDTLKAFSDFQGINRGTNDLVRPKNQCKNCDDFELDDDFSLILRKGEKAECSLALNGSKSFIGMLNHVYSSIDDGSIKEKLIFFSRGIDINSPLAIPYVLKYGKLEFDLVLTTRPNLTYSMVARTTGSVGFDFILKSNGTTILTFDCGRDQSLGNGSTISQLKTAINALANVHCELTPYSIVNGNQTINATTALNVTSTTVYGGESLLDEAVLLSAVHPTALYPVTSYIPTTAIWIKTPVNLTFTNGQELGIGTRPAYTLPLCSDVLVTSFPTIRIPYLAPIKRRFDVAFFDPLSPYLMPPNGVNISNSLFIAGQFINVDGIYKFDGNSIYKAGVPTVPAIGTLSASGGGGLTISSTYTYAFSLLFTDFQGYEIEGELTSLVQKSLSAVENLIGIPYTPHTGASDYYNMKANTFSAIYVAQTTIVLNNTNEFEIGDRVWFLNHLTQLSISAIIANIRGNTIILDTPITASNVAWNIVSTYKMRTYRSKAGGNQLYQTYDLPYPCRAGLGATNISDGKADSALGFAYITPDEVDRRFVPPAMHAIEEHQGRLVGTGNFANPNTVTFSSNLSPEYMNPTNSFEASGANQGKLTALKSDNENMLALFKEDAYYNVVGDLGTGNFSFDIGADGSVGCLSQNAIQRIKGGIVFPSSVGFQLLSNGRLDPNFNNALMYSFRNKITNRADQFQNDGYYGGTNINLAKAVSANDSDSSKYICSIPSEDILIVSDSYYFPNANTKTFVYDYEKNSWFERTYVEHGTVGYGLCPYMGLTIYNKKPYWLAVSNGGQNQHLVSANNSKTNYDYITGSYGIPALVDLQWEDFNLPSLNKEFTEFKLYCFDPASDFATIPFSIKVSVLKDFLNAVMTSKVMSLSASERESVFKMASNKARSILVRFENKDSSDAVTRNNPIRITGYEINYAKSYTQDSIKP